MHTTIKLWMTLNIEAAGSQEKKKLGVLTEIDAIFSLAAKLSSVS